MRASTPPANVEVIVKAIKTNPISSLVDASSSAAFSMSGITSPMVRQPNPNNSG